MRIEIPDYETFAEFPDDMDPEQVKQVMSTHFPSLIPKTLDEYIAINSHPEARRLSTNVLRNRNPLLRRS